MKVFFLMPPDAVPTMRTMSDTAESVRMRHMALVAQLTPAERLMRTLELSAFVRQIARAGARQVAGADGERAVRDRFFEQVYGGEMTDSLRVLLSRL